jgi:hypothetical protein
MRVKKRKRTKESINSSKFPVLKKDRVLVKKKKKKKVKEGKGPTTAKKDINNNVRNGKKVTTSKARMGKKNGRWKGGRSKSYRRAVSNAKPGQHVHHKDHNKKNNKRSNFKNVSPAQHNKEHPEKGGHNKKKRRKKNAKK